MKFLVDADVLSEPTKPTPNLNVVGWLSRHQAQLAISAIVLGELEYGILLLPASRKRARLLEWFAEGIGKLNVLEFDARCASAWAELLARLKKRGQAMPIKDSLIAATAVAHGLSVATRNTLDFQHARVTIVDPFAT